DREVLLCSGLPHCEPPFFCPLRGPIAGNACRAASPEERGDGFPSVPSLGFLPGGGVPRHSANGTRPALGPPARDSCQQFSLHLWSVALLPLLAHSPCSTDVRWHFRHRLVLRGVVQEIGQFVDGDRKRTRLKFRHGSI